MAKLNIEEIQSYIETERLWIQECIEEEIKYSGGKPREWNRGYQAALEIIKNYGFGIDIDLMKIDEERRKIQENLSVDESPCDC